MADIETTINAISDIASDKRKKPILTGVLLSVAATAIILAISINVMEGEV